METYKNLKKSTKIGLIISAILCILLLCFCTVELISPIRPNVPNAPEGQMTPPAENFVNLPGFLRPALNIALCLAICLYAFWGYKKPHGNMLKYTFLSYAAYLLVYAMIDTMTMSKNFIANGLIAFSALLVAYIAGRLNKLEKNKILLIVIGVALTVNIILGMIVREPLMESFAFEILLPLVRNSIYLVALAALSLAYVARYEEHKAAGLADKADAEAN